MESLGNSQTSIYQGIKAISNIIAVCYITVMFVEPCDNIPQKCPYVGYAVVVIVAEPDEVSV